MGDRRYTLEELAAASGMTARNVRAYRTKGLIHPPERMGRRAMYSTEHLESLLRVRDAQAQGVPLRMIVSLVASGASLPTAGTASALVGSLAQVSLRVPEHVRSLVEEAAPDAVESLVGLGVLR